MLPGDQVHILVRLPRCQQHLHRVAQQVVGAHVGLVERNASGIGGVFQLLQGGGDVGIRISALLEVCPEIFRFYGSIVVALAPITQMVIAKTVRPGCVGKHGGHAILGQPLRARFFRHWTLLASRDGSCRLAIPASSLVSCFWFCCGAVQGRLSRRPCH